MPNDAVAGTIDYLASVMREPVISAHERDELQRIYSSLVANWQGRRRNSMWTEFGEKARQGNVNGLSLLEFAARQLDERDHNALGKRKLNPETKPESEAELNPSPMAEKLRRQYKDEFTNLANLPALQVDALWNEVLLYAKIGFDILRKRSQQNTALQAYQLPEITEAATLDFLLLPFVTSAGKHPISLDKFERRYLESGRRIASKAGYFTPGYAAELIKIAYQVMEKTAKANGIDVSGRIAHKNFLVEKLEGGSFIDTFWPYGKDQLYQAAAEGEALYVFRKIADIEDRAYRYHIPLELLVSCSETGFLRMLAVNNPKRGLKGELLDIANSVLSGELGRSADLELTDDFIGFSRDEKLVDAYQKIKSAIGTLADSAYRRKYAVTAQASQEPVFVDSKPAEISALVNAPSLNKVARSRYPMIGMSEDDARAILSMFESGDYRGIVSYKSKPADPETAAVATYSSGSPAGASRRRRDTTYEKVAAIGLAAGAAFAALMIGINPGNVGQTAEGKKPAQPKKIEVICDDAPKMIYGQGSRYGDRTGPEIVCKQSEPSIEKYIPEFPKSPSILEQYDVIEGDNLTHIVKRILGVRGGDERVERAAYLTARKLGELNGIPKPYDLIHPRQRLMIPLDLRSTYIRFLRN